MKTIHKKRLLKVYEYMQQPQRKLAHKRFYFGVFNDSPQLPTQGDTCGTMGCMGGELPAIFPEYWRWRGFGIDLIKSKEPNWVRGQLADFFGLNIVEVSHIFYPCEQSFTIDPYYRTHKILNSTATKRRVVDNLRRFLIIRGILHE